MTQMTADITSGRSDGDASDTFRRPTCALSEPGERVRRVLECRRAVAGCRNEDLEVLALIPLLPFAGFVVNAAIGRRLSKTISGGLACAVMVASFLIAAAQVWTLAGMPAESRSISQTVFTWISSGDFTIDLTFRLDTLASVMVLVITGIGSLIHIYSIDYMHEETDADYARFFSYLNLFVFFMLLLVLGANVLVMFVGWEGVGLCSYLLIGFYYQKPSAADAAKKAFVVNRIGDFAFILGTLLLVVTVGSLDFQTIATNIGAREPEVAFGTLSLIALLLFIGATGKSAQIPLFVWLPDAMEGPTPVSALIHAATMVTAGVYMIGRNAVLFEHAPITLQIVAVIGAATAFFAGTIGLVQNDIKRVLAYSTVSQLGYMFLAMGVGAFGAGIFHLFTHAFFKALLFLGSGAVIHALHGEQDIRHMGGLRKHLPVTYWTFLIGSLAIAGIPGLSGFFSKDEILYQTFHNGHQILWTVGILTSLLTATYMFRLVYLTFFGEVRFGDGAHGRRPPHGGHHASSRRGAAGARGPVSHRQPPDPSARCSAGDGVHADRAGDRIGVRGLSRYSARARWTQSDRHVARAVVRGRQLRPGRHGRDRRSACRHGARGLRTRRRRGKSVVGSAPATCATCRTCTNL